MASTTSDYNEIMRLLGNADQVNAAIAADHASKGSSSRRHAMTPQQIRDAKAISPVIKIHAMDADEIGTPGPNGTHQGGRLRKNMAQTNDYWIPLPDEDDDDDPSNDAENQAMWAKYSDAIYTHFDGIVDQMKSEMLKGSIMKPEMSQALEADGYEGHRFISLPGYVDEYWASTDSGEQRTAGLRLYLDDTGEETIGAKGPHPAQVKNYDVETFRFPKNGEPQPFADVYHNKRSVAVEWMMNSGLDFLSNMWDISIICTRLQGDKVVRWDDLFNQFYRNEIVFGSTKIPKFMGDAAGFMVRCEGVDVPQPKSQSYSMEFLWTTIQKVRSKVDLERKATLKVLLDEPLYFMELFNLLSNNNDLTDRITVRPLLNVPFTTLPMWADDLKTKKVQMNVIVKHALLMRHSVYDELRASDDPIAKNQGGLGPTELPYWVFEDVNFIGSTTDLEFKRDGPSTTTIDVPFLFKRVYKVDRQARGGTKTTPDVALQSPRDPLDATMSTLSNTQHDQTWYYGERTS
jgi:hypothetical protein